MCITPILFKSGLLRAERGYKFILPDRKLHIEIYLRNKMATMLEIGFQLEWDRSEDPGE